MFCCTCVVVLVILDAEVQHPGDADVHNVLIQALTARKQLGKSAVWSWSGQNTSARNDERNSESNLGEHRLLHSWLTPGMRRILLIVEKECQVCKNSEK